MALGSWLDLLLLNLFFLLGIVSRYFVLSHAFVWLFRPQHSAAQAALQPKEIYYSLFSCFIFGGVFAVLTILFWQGVFVLPTGFWEMTWMNSLVAPLLFLLGHDFYYYILHRWMHHPQVFHRFHYTHHLNRSPTVWTSFAFHPIEAMIQAAYFVVFFMFCTIHLFPLVLCLLWMSLSATINHGGKEIFSEKFRNTLPFAYVITYTHHYQHHQKFRGNYGLYFNVFDRLFGTELPP